jgi:REP element-mobilizing transposase RayT
MERNNMSDILAYFITWTTYGTWLHGASPGSVDPAHNTPGTPFLESDPVRHHGERRRMADKPYSLDAPQRRVVLKTIQEVCTHRGWELLAAHVRSAHVHVVVRADAETERVMNDFKAYASRALNAAQLDGPFRKRWTRHGSTRYIKNPAHLAAAIHYTLHCQGPPMEVFDPREPRPSGSGTPPEDHTPC